MFDNTKLVFNKMLADIKRIGFAFSLVTNLINIFYLIYACFTRRGILWVNIVLLAITVGYFIVFVATYYNKSKIAKQVKLRARRITKWSKIAIKAFTLFVAIYGIYSAAENVSFFSVLLVAFMVIGWVFQVVTEILIYVIRKQKELLLTALQKDIEPFLKVRDAVVKPFKVASGVKSKIKSFFSRKKKAPELEKGKELLLLEGDKPLSKKEQRKLKKQLKKASK